MKKAKAAENEEKMSIFRLRAQRVRKEEEERGLVRRKRTRSWVIRRRLRRER